MKLILLLGKWLYIIPILIFGIFHLTNSAELAILAPGGVPIVILTGICLILAGLSMIIEKLDQLATVLLGIMLIIFIIPHIQMMSENPNEMANILKNIALAGGAFLYSSKYAKDKTFVS